MKATLEFTLPADDYDFKCACKATELASVLRELDNEMRSKLKHSSGNLDSDIYHLLEQWRQDINEAIQGIEV